MIKKALLLVGLISSVSYCAPVYYIQLRDTLQTGATFYVSSGTVKNLNASTATINVLNVSTFSWRGNQSSVVVSFSSFTIASSSSTTSQTFVPTGLKRTITPKTPSSHFEISVVGLIGGSNVVAATPVATLERNGNDLGASSSFGFCSIDATTAPANQLRVPCSFTTTDYPATGSSVTYEIYIRSNGAATAAWGLNDTKMFIKEWSQ